MVCVCMVQQGQIPQATREKLAKGLHRAAQDVLGDYAAELQVAWMDIAEGSGYTAGHPSTSSLVGMPVPDGTNPATREALLSAICSTWTVVTGCSVNEIVATAFDESAMPQTI